MKSYYMNTQKVSAAKETPEFLNSGCDERNLCQVESMSLEEANKNLE